MSVMVVTNGLDEVMEIVGASGHGLSASILTNRLDAALEFIHRVTVGMASIKFPTTGIEYQAPLGWNLSGGPAPEAGRPRLTSTLERRRLLSPIRASMMEKAHE